MIVFSTALLARECTRHAEASLLDLWTRRNVATRSPVRSFLRLAGFDAIGDSSVVAESGASVRKRASLAENTVNHGADMDGRVRRTQRVTSVVLTVEHAIAILAKLAETRSGTALKLAEQLSLNRTVVHRLLVTLEKHGYVHADGSSYRLGFGLLRLANSVEFDLRGAAVAELPWLAEQADMSAVLVIRDGLQFVQLDQSFPSSGSEPEIRYPAGFRAPLLNSGHGRAILAYTTPDTIDRSLTEFRSGMKKHYLALLTEVRERGYAESRSELRLDVAGIAVPIFNPNRDPIASIGFVCHTNSPPDVELVVPLAQGAARRIEDRLFG